MLVLRLTLGLLAMIALLFGSRDAAAQDKPTLSGSWTASALTESWSVTEWGDACGPRPTPQGSGGGAVQIREQGGELSIVGAGRAFSTAECWEQMPGVSRASHSGGGRFWRTRCASAPNDSRRAAITTSISATDSTISLNEIGDYTFKIKDTTCHATVSRSRSYAVVHREGDAPAASASAAPSAAPSAPPAAPTREPRQPAPSRCSGAPGDPARLEVHPSRKLLRAGDKFLFHAVVLDGEGCATSTRPMWFIGPGPLASKASIDAAGTLAVEADAGEGTLEITASVADRGVILHVDVASPEHYDAMLALSDADGGEAEQTAVAVIASGTIGGRTAAAEDAGAERKRSLVAIVAGAALVLAFAGLVIVRRGSRPVEVPDDDEPAPESVAPPPSIAEPPAPAPQPVVVPKSRGKICPTCGERYPSDAGFCGKDSTKLVLLN